MFDLLGSFMTMQDADLAAVLLMADRIMEHVDVHFTMEEDLMGRWDYPEPELSEHIGEHDELRQSARDAVLGFRSEGSSDGATLLEFLRDGLVEHIEERDRRLVTYIQAARAAGVETR
jgi:hemerythrin-like metal-binding protein